MKRELYFLVAWLVLSFPVRVFSSSIFGGSGLVHLPYADTAIKGSYDLGLFTVYSQYKNDLRGQTGHVYLTSYYGIFDWLELDFNFPFYLVSPEWMGVSSPFLGVKSRFLNKKWIKFSLLPYIKPSFAGDVHVGTGKFGYGASLVGQLNFKQISLLGRVGYEKGEYFNPNMGKYIQEDLLLGAAGVEWDLTPQINLFGEIIGSSARESQDEDLFFQTGLKFFPIPHIYLTFSFGTGLAGELRSNTDRRVVAGLTYYYTPLPPPSQPSKPVIVKVPEKQQKKSPVPQSISTRKKPVVKVISACGDMESARQIATMFKKQGLEVVESIGSSNEMVYTTEIIFSTAQKLAFQIARWIPGRQKLIKKVLLGYDADIVVRVGCDVSKKAKEKKKPISEIKIAVLNACQSGVLVAENVAKILLLAGYNVERIGEYDKYDHKNYTEVLYKPLYRDYAEIIAAKIPGQQKLTQVPPAYGEEEIIILVGCDQMKQ